LEFTTGFDSNKGASHAAASTESQWDKVIRNCGIMHGLIIDREKKQDHQGSLQFYAQTLGCQSACQTSIGRSAYIEGDVYRVNIP
jgi:hypothetical protein